MKATVDKEYFLCFDSDGYCFGWAKLYEDALGIIENGHQNNGSYVKKYSDSIDSDLSFADQVYNFFENYVLYQQSGFESIFVSRQNYVDIVLDGDDSKLHVAVDRIMKHIFNCENYKEEPLDDDGDVRTWDYVTSDWYRSVHHYRPITQ